MMTMDALLIGTLIGLFIVFTGEQILSLVRWIRRKRKLKWTKRN